VTGDPDRRHGYTYVADFGKALVRLTPPSWGDQITPLEMALAVTMAASVRVPETRTRDRSAEKIREEPRGAARVRLLGGPCRAFRHAHQAVITLGVGADQVQLSLVQMGTRSSNVVYYFDIN
jgi:hypothetical protein